MTGSTLTGDPDRRWMNPPFMDRATEPVSTRMQITAAPSAKAEH
jgi:hypothetical protein